MSFVFSADDHLVEPSDLFSTGLAALVARPRPEGRKTRRFHLLARRRQGLEPNASSPRCPQAGPGRQPFGRPDRRGNREVEWCLKDMALDGVDAEILFPSLILHVSVKYPKAAAKFPVAGDKGFLSDRRIRLWVIKVKCVAKRTVGDSWTFCRIGFDRCDECRYF